jgi:hypothetical protein
VNEDTLVKLPVAERRGAWTTYGGDTWFSFLFAGGIDAVAAGMEGIVDVGLVRRDVTSQVLDGKLPAPDGRWALLVELVGSDWVHFAAPEMLNLFHRDFKLGNRLAEQSGLRVLTTGHEDCSGATFVEVQEGAHQVLYFESTGDDFRGVEVTSPADLDDMEDWDGTFSTVFKSESHPPDWWKQFDREDKVHQALLTELKAYVPLVQALAGDKGMVELFACHEDAIERENVRRIDLVVFGDAKLAIPNPANAQLASAIKEGNVDAVRAAIAAGAELTILKNSTTTPLTYAVGLIRVKEPHRIDVVRALLEAGADPNEVGPKDDPPLFTAVGKADALPVEALEVMKLLLDAGADIEGRGTGLFMGGLTPLHRAVNETSLAAVQLLLSRGADLHSLDSSGQMAVERIPKIIDSLKQQLGEELAGKQIRSYQKILEYLDHVERGGDIGDPQQHIPAEQAAAESKRRRLQAKGEQFKRTMEEFGKLFQDAKAQTCRQIEESLLKQPDRISLERHEKADWADVNRVDADTGKLTKVGFTRVGDFSINEMPGILIRGFVHPEQRVVAAIGQTIQGVTWWDVVRFHIDGSALTATSAPIIDGMERYQSEKFEKLYCADEPISFLLSEMRAVHPDTEPVAVEADRFAERFESYYAEDIAAKKACCGQRK